MDPGIFQAYVTLIHFERHEARALPLRVRVFRERIAFRAVSNSQIRFAAGRECGIDGVASSIWVTGVLSAAASEDTLVTLVDINMAGKTMEHPG